MPFCTNCGKQFSDGTKFCPECGTAINAVEPENQRKQVFEGEIKKCPNCGEALSAFEITCHACGFELRNRTGSSAVQKLADMISKLEMERPPQAQKETISLFKYSIPSAEPTDKRIANVIQSFVIPNTKEDILEFIFLAANSIDADALDSTTSKGSSEGLSRNLIAKAWVTKFEQAYRKAKLSFGDSPEFNDIQAIYDRKQKEIRKGRTKTNRELLTLLLIFVAFMLFMLFLMLWLLKPTPTEDSSAQETSTSYQEDSKENIEELKKSSEEFKEGMEEYSEAYKEAYQNIWDGYKSFFTGICD